MAIDRSMQPQKMLRKIASFSYGVYSIPYGYVTDDSGQLATDRFAVADLEDGEDGFYLTTETIEDAFVAMDSQGMLTCGE